MGRGRVLRTEINAPTYSARYNDPQGPINDYYDIPAAPYLKLSAVHDDKAGTLTLFALNRSLAEEMPLTVTAAGFPKLALKEALQLCDPDLKAVNSKAQPDRITPKPLSKVKAAGEKVEAVLPPASWNVIRLGT
jgi:alpha-N-arabinofuranosidase